VRLNTGDHDGALEQLERAIAVDPQNGYAYYFLATAHFRRRAYDQAILFADRAAALLEGRDSAWASRACALEGRVYETVARFADARAAYGRALKADPTNRDAAAGLARVGGTGSQR
jgi:tetratricopeptide (TPR) repeat protein